MLPEKKLTELNMTWTAFRTPIIELGFGERSYYFLKKNSLILNVQTVFVHGIFTN
jgi:hypothetical protein